MGARMTWRVGAVHLKLTPERGPSHVILRVNKRRPDNGNRSFILFGEQGG